MIYIELAKLDPHPDNVRRTPAGKAADAELKASIAALGLLDNLVVQRSTTRGRFLVVDGSRRLAAMRKLAAEGHPQWKPGGDAQRVVPCLVLRGTANASEASLAANVVRAALHPADQIEAFGALAEQGESVARIAARFGVSERVVGQRLGLAGVAPEIRDAYRDDRLSMEALEAFASTADQARQVEVWKLLVKAMAKGIYGSVAHWVRQRIDAQRVSASHRLARFVGIAAYEAAGGVVEHDLFRSADSTYLHDPALLEELAHGKLAAEGKRRDLLDRWAWLITALDPRDLGSFTAAAPVDGGYTDEVRAVAGCVIELTWDGEVRVHRGLYHAGDEPGAAAVPADEGGGGAAVPVPADEEPPAGPEPKPLSDRVLDALRVERFEHVRGALKHRNVLDVLGYTLGVRIIGKALGMNRLPGVIEWGRLSTHCASDSVLRATEGLDTEWLTAPDPWKAYLALPSATRNALLRVAVGAMLDPQLATDPGADPVPEDLARNVAWRKVRPTVAGYWRLLTRHQILEAAGEVLGEGWVQRHKVMKKADLAAAAEAAFAGDSDIDNPAIDQYTIPGFAPVDA